MSTLKVGTIQDHANSNNALVIDSSGRVTQPAKPAFTVTRHSSSADLYLSGHVVFDTVQMNVGNCWDGTKTFQAPVAGAYHFSMSGFCAGTNGQLTDGTEYKGYLQKSQQSNFSDVSGATGHLAQTYCYISGTGGAGYFTVTMSATVLLAANDYVRYFVSAGRLYANVASTRYSPVFSGFLIG